MRRRAALLVACALGCGAQEPAPSSVPSAPIVVPSTTASAPAPERSTALRGCSDADARRVRGRIEDLAIAQAAPDAVFADLDQRLKAVLASPCLAHLALVGPRERPTDLAALRTLWRAGLGEALAADAGGFATRDAGPTFVFPPTTRAPPTNDMRLTLARWTCYAAPSCDNTFRWRADDEAAFDAAEAADRKSRSATPSRSCLDLATRGADRTDALTPFEAWARCVAANFPRTQRYPPIAFHTPEKGWLAIRGFRGHSGPVDTRVFDLATGAVYGAHWEYSMIAGRPNRLTTLTGIVDPDKVRHLLFTLVAGPGLAPCRSTADAIAVPPSLPLALSPVPPPPSDDYFRVFVSDTGQRPQTWALVDDDGTVDASGTFTWPHSEIAAQQRADEVLASVESSLTPGCAPAMLPKTWGDARAAMRATGGDAEAGVFGDLDRAIEKLRKTRCAKP